jgi:hypothetical protein
MHRLKMVLLLISKNILINGLFCYFWVLFRYTKEEHLLKKAKEFVQEGFPRATNFQPNSILIATWKDVHSYSDKENKVSKLKYLIIHFFIQ